MKKRESYKTKLSCETVDKIEKWIEDIDEDEEFETRCDKAIDCLIEDGIEEYFDVEDSELNLFDASDEAEKLHFLTEEFIRVVAAMRDGVVIETEMSDDERGNA